MDDWIWLDEYLKSKAGAAKDYKAEWGWERYMVGEKLFAATCCPGDKYAPEYAGRPLLTLKCDQLEAEFLRQQYADILPGFYMDKRSWISIRLDGNVPADIIKGLCDASYGLVFAKLTKKMQRQILENDI